MSKWCALKQTVVGSESLLQVQVSLCLVQQGKMEYEIEWWAVIQSITLTLLVMMEGFPCPHDPLDLWINNFWKSIPEQGKD